MPNFQNSNKSNLHNHSHDTRDLNAGKEKAMSEAKFMFEIKDIVGSGTESHANISFNVGCLHEIGSWTRWWVGS